LKILLKHQDMQGMWSINIWFIHVGVRGAGTNRSGVWYYAIPCGHRQVTSWNRSCPGCIQRRKTQDYGVLLLQRLLGQILAGTEYTNHCWTNRQGCNIHRERL